MASSQPPSESGSAPVSSNSTAVQPSPSGNKQCEDITVTTTAPEQSTTQQPSNPRLEALRQKQAKLSATLATLQAEKASLVSEATLHSTDATRDTWTDEEKSKRALEDAHGVIKEHIALLHRYNELKDIGQGLMGLIADGRGVRVASVMEEFGIEEKD